MVLTIKMLAGCLDSIRGVYLPQCDGDDGLASSECRGACYNAVVDGLAADLRIHDLGDGRTTALLLMDLLQGWLLRAIVSEEPHGEVGSRI
jgi:hypothetical protein